MDPDAASVQGWLDYVAAMDRLHGLDLSRERSLEVAANLQRIEAMVTPLMAFDLPEGLDPAPVFQP